MKPELPATNRGNLPSRTLIYINKRGGVPRPWSQTLDGGPPKQLTDFKVNGVWQRAWSHDGKSLALVRGTVTKDVVLIKDFSQC